MNEADAMATEEKRRNHDFKVVEISRNSSGNGAAELIGAVVGEEHKLASIGGLWATAVGASVAYGRRKTPQMRLIHARLHAQALTLAVLGGAALAHHYYNPSSKTNNSSSLDYDFYSQLPPATTDDGQENERWSW
ncbi:hypothetical protein OsJ_34977 [Oryza sativa Japonica Group]|uniref:HIG1 domain-containing protein n=1 Tax=Oryza sativa subsp. japonica TaxID=39947 RepID=A3CEA7_ORYSJ|nr:hypothetical protein OsJ_34977 [Oryza sativa Japonica Group]